MPYISFTCSSPPMHKLSKQHTSLQHHTFTLQERKKLNKLRRRPILDLDRLIGNIMADAGVSRLASQRAVVIFAASNCFMCHAVKTLFTELGVSWAVYEVDKEPRGKDVERALAGMLGRSPPVPAVFIGGKLVGPTDRVMSLHLGGKLVPLLREAGALWL
ncbi:hypothetical protein ACP4OV_030271 [Aristida adscensionis]